MQEICIYLGCVKTPVSKVYVWWHTHKASSSITEADLDRAFTQLYTTALDGNNITHRDSVLVFSHRQIGCGDGGYIQPVIIAHLLGTAPRFEGDGLRKLLMNSLEFDRSSIASSMYMSMTFAPQHEPKCRGYIIDNKQITDAVFAHLRDNTATFAVIPLRNIVEFRAHK